MCGCVHVCVSADTCLNIMACVLSWRVASAVGSSVVLEAGCLFISVYPRLAGLWPGGSPVPASYLTVECCSYWLLHLALGI